MTRRRVSPRNVTFRLEPTTRTDLVCVACGGFRTEYAVALADGGESQAGAHAGCVERVRARRATRTRGRGPSNDVTPTGTDGE